MWPGSHSVEGSSSSTDSDQHILYTYIHAERCDSEPEEIHSDTDSRAPVGVRPRRRLGYRGREDVVRVAAAGARWSRGNGPGRAGTSAQAGPVTRPGRPSGLPCRQSRRCGPRTPVRSGPARRRRAPGTRAAAVERHRRNYIYTYIYICNFRLKAQQATMRKGATHSLQLHCFPIKAGTLLRGATASTVHRCSGGHPGIAAPGARAAVHHTRATDGANGAAGAGAIDSAAGAAGATGATGATERGQSLTGCEPACAATCRAGTGRARPAGVGIEESDPERDSDERPRMRGTRMRGTRMRGTRMRGTRMSDSESTDVSDTHGHPPSMRVCGT